MVVVLGAVVLAVPPADGKAQGMEATTGALVVIGGGLSADNEDVYEAILSQRHGDGPLCVIPTASASPASSMESAVARIDRWGGPGTAWGILLSVDSPERANDPGIAEEISRCSGFFFTGGVQSRITEFFLPGGRESSAYRALMDRFRRGAVVAGSSAGAAMMSDPMISGGTSGAALERGLGGEDVAPGVRLDRGMGLIDAVVFDQHFLARGRMGRLWVAILEDDGVEWGIGIDEDTAILIHEGQGHVIGASGVVVVVPGTGQPHASDHEAFDLRVELLGNGDRLDLMDLSVLPAADKRPVSSASLPSEPTVFQGESLFDRWEFLRLFHEIGSWPEDRAVFTAHHHSIEIRRGAEFRTLANVGVNQEGVQGTPPGLSVGPLWIRMDYVEEASVSSP